MAAKRRCCVGVVAVLTTAPNRRAGKKVAGALFMDVRSAFDSVGRAHLGRRMEALEIEPDLIRWAGSFMPDRQVKLVVLEEVGDWHPPGIPSAACPLYHVLVG